MSPATGQQEQSISCRITNIGRRGTDSQLDDSTEDSILVSDERQHISRKHAVVELSPQGDRLTIVGKSINMLTVVRPGMPPVQAHKAVELNDGDLVQLDGFRKVPRFVFRVQLAQDPAPPASSATMQLLGERKLALGATELLEARKRKLAQRKLLEERARQAGRRKLSPSPVKAAAAEVPEAQAAETSGAQAAGGPEAEEASQGKSEFVEGEDVQCPECFRMNRATQACEFMTCTGAYCGARLTPQRRTMLKEEVGKRAEDALDEEATQEQVAEEADELDLAVSAAVIQPTVISLLDTSSEEDGPEHSDRCAASRKRKEAPAELLDSESEDCDSGGPDAGEDVAANDDDDDDEDDDDSDEVLPAAVGDHVEVDRRYAGDGGGGVVTAVTAGGLVSVKYFVGGSNKNINPAGIRVTQRKSPAAAGGASHEAVDVNQIAENCWKEIEQAKAGGPDLGNPHDQFAVAGMYHALRPPPGGTAEVAQQTIGLTVQLREYQKRALNWMLNREKPSKSASCIRGGILAEEVSLP